MSPLERFLLLGILFLLLVRFFMLPDSVERTGREALVPESADATAGGAPADNGPYEWDPAQFSRRGIPTKLTLTPEGRVPDIMRLNDTQKTFVYATMIETYDSLLKRAHRDCPLDLRRDILRWQARHARTIADAAWVLETLTPGREDARKVHALMTRDAFAKRICPTVEHYLATGAYDPHPEAVSRLAHAARGAKPE
ncbi:MAG: hypothetical protein COW30_01645 [Rhodospirillales bacterium CG15_BIG_FIL_POST_REV_8_21_14_020_66_15]|nr:MAG: hypothetical protein COW30_01645 [Rhodospirillales bacterium CG15_BIG_FIL_POST_REV_8_21_14_020_66_15]